MRIIKRKNQHPINIPMIERIEHITPIIDIIKTNFLGKTQCSLLFSVKLNARFKS